MSEKGQIICKDGEVVIDNLLGLPDLTGERERQQVNVDSLCTLYCQAQCQLTDGYRKIFLKLLAKANQAAADNEDT